MSGAHKLIGWTLFAAIVVVLVATSGPLREHKEGYQGSYLGRSVDGQQANAGRAEALGSRTATQRY